ncbi:MAG: acyl-CoA mutase large subunit family protein [Puniceicoccales bacterium]|jgi:methylmalonyl-CoA mutase|nr:acyl-CoA mutase large subunit family protein [Puniceicoccales bacterium]
MSETTTETTAAEKLAAEFAPTSHEEWKAAAEKLLKGAPFDKIMLTKTPENITLQPIYERPVLDSLPAAATLPGQDGYLRGTGAAGYRAEAWDVAQEIPLADPAAYNAALLHDLGVGQNAVSVDFGRPNALRLDGAKDITTAFRGVVPAAVAWHFHPGLRARDIAKLFWAWLTVEKADAKQVRGSLNYDPLGVLAARGSLPKSLENLYDDLANIVRDARTFLPAFTAIGVHTGAYHNAGASAVEELGIALATGVEYLRALDKRGVGIEEAAPLFAFHLAVGGNFFVELAKLRAARPLWARIVAEFGGSEKARALHLHARTGLFNKTKHDPHVNILRTTTETLGAVLAGVESITVGAYDELVRTPDEASRRLARNTQIILQEECELTSVIDPAGGSWYVEKLTDEIAAASWAFFQEIEGKGGLAAALDAGFVQERIAATRKGKEKLFGQRRLSLVGTNQYPNIAEKPLAGATTGDAPCCSGAPDANAVVVVPPLPAGRLAVSYERLRAASAAYKEKNGHGPKIHLANIGALRRHKARADFTRGFFETGGFEITGAEGSTDPVVIAERAVASGAQLIVICGHDEDYATLVPAICSEIKTRAPQLTVILAGNPGEKEAEFKAAGLDTFIFVKSDNYETNRQYLEKVGAL